MTIAAQARTIHASEARFSGRERQYVLDCLERGWITQGRYVREFEEQFAAMCGARHAIACSSGTAALHLAMVALGIGPGSTVVVPALTYVATANAARYCGATVRFADVLTDTWCIDIAHADELGGDLIVPVHLYDAQASVGQDCLEDAAHAPGTWGVGGGLARISAFSFYASKVVACGEGGMVTTNDDELAALVRLYRGQGAPTPGRYHHTVVGFNYRMTDLQAAVGLAQLEQLPLNLAMRRALVDRYRGNLGGGPVALQGGARASAWAMAVLLPYGANREQVARALASEGVETRPFFEPLPSLPPYRSDVPVNAAAIAWRGLVLPTHCGMTEGDVDYVCERLLAAVESEC
jgi:perosamine synthetase